MVISWAQIFVWLIVGVIGGTLVGVAGALAA